MKIVALDGETLNPGDNPWTEIERLGELTVYPRTDPEEALERASSAEIVLTNKVVLDAPLLKQLPQLKFISITATGVNVVDIDAACQRDILVANVPVYSTDSVAQHVFAGLLSLLHRPELHDRAIRDGAWKQSGNFSFWKTPLIELAGKTIGIVGFGRIGQAVARIAEALNMNVVFTSRSQPALQRFEKYRWLDLQTLFSVSDVITLHCPLTEENFEFVNREQLSLMKPTAILINTARGGLIRERDLADALNENRLRAAFLDVVSSEPIADDNPLLAAQNCLLTPHLGWASIEARQRLMHSTADNVAAFISGNPINLVGARSGKENNSR